MWSIKTTKQRQISSGLENLDDNMLVEILRRLPNAETAAQCKLVSKRWNSLISDPFFISRFHHHHRDQEEEEEEEEDYALLVGVRNEPIRELVTAGYAFPLDGNPRAEKFFSPRFSFASFIPPHVLGSNFIIMASCGDLLLCLRKPSIAYVVCNPITRQWISLPPRPSLPPHPIRVCGRCAILREEEGVRFRVLIFAADFKNQSGDLYLYIYYSETGEWHRWHPLDFYLYAPDYTTFVAYKGKLHWFNHHRNLVACDPFRTPVDLRDDSTCSLFDVIDSGSELKKYTGLAYRSCRLRLGVCRDILRVMWLDEDRMKLRFFDLKDYDSGRWTFNCGGPTRTLLSGNPNLPELCEMDGWRAKDVAFHPTNPAVVFLGIWGAVLKCNLRKKQVHVLSLLPNDFCHFYDGSCTLLIPRWPTPISSPHPLPI